MLDMQAAMKGISSNYGWDYKNIAAIFNYDPRTVEKYLTDKKPVDSGNKNRKSINILFKLIREALKYRIKPPIFLSILHTEIESFDGKLTLISAIKDNPDNPLIYSSFKVLIEHLLESRVPLSEDKKQGFLESMLTEAGFDSSILK